MNSSSAYSWVKHTCVMAALGLCAATSIARASGITVTVTDREGLPVPDVAVFVETPAAGIKKAPPGTTAVMDQVDQRFVPHMLMVQTGTKVEFPNSDTVAHHVYSFSHPNHFKLPIYKGHAHPPVSFEENGIVILGCNIHDHMLAYIVVVDTPVFAKTDADGVAVFESGPVAGATVSVWSPRFREDAEVLSVTVEDATADNAIAFRLTRRLRPAHEDQPEALSWSEY
jgi:plastocyanin